MASENNQSPTLAWQVKRYSRREGASWVPVDDGTGSFTLLAKAGQLMLIQSGIVLESLPLSNHDQMHGIMKGDTLLVAARRQAAARKFKIRFSSIQISEDCVKYLQDFFPVKVMTKPEDNVPIPLGQMYQHLMQAKPVDCLPSPDPIPASFPLEETLHMCILDPSFPELVGRVASILSNFDIGKENN